MPFIGHLLSARLCEAHSTSLPIIAFNPLAQPLKQVLSLPPLYRQETGDSKRCASPKHLSQFAVMSLFSYQLFFPIPCWTGAWGEAVSSSTQQNAESSVDSSDLLNEGMQPHRTPQLPRGRARLTKRQAGDTRAMPSRPSTLQSPFSLYPNCKGQKKICSSKATTCSEEREPRREAQSMAKAQQIPLEHIRTF